jgi:hypothetical protein
LSAWCEKKSGDVVPWLLVVMTTAKGANIHVGIKVAL